MKEKEVLVKVEGLSKKFCKNLKTSLKYGVQDLFSNFLGNKDERLLREKEFWAVKDISFELRRGECLGLIGHNGAGKSTLLKILNGLIKPDAGKVTIRGKVGALIELGAGFNPILTGRENIYNNGAVLGFTRKEIDSKVEEIIDFAEIREFIDMPVQNYSSGMKVRLGFAVAAQMEPDVLIIDEVLAVGDVGFRIKCMNRITELLKSCTIIFVSHSMPQVAKISSKALLLDRGEMVRLSSEVGDICLTYLNRFEMEKSYKIKHDLNYSTDVRLLSGNFSLSGNRFEISREENLIFEVELNLAKEIKHYGFTFLFNDVELKPVATISSLSDNGRFRNDKIDKKTHRIEIENHFAPGRYSVDFNVIEIIDQNQWGKFLYQHQNCLMINIINSSSLTHVPIQFKGTWEIYEREDVK